MVSRFCWSIFLPFFFLPALHPTSPLLAGPRVDIVIGEKAPALERLAADELSNQLKRIYEADVKIASTAPPDAPHVIFVGSPDTNANMKPLADSWPSGDKKLTDQGHLLRSVTHNNRPALLIGGGSPVATYWAVAEFGHRLGIRSMLFGDLDPVNSPPFKLDGFEIVMEPKHRLRDWRFSIEHPTDAGAWGLEEFQQVLRQLSKLKFNRVTIDVDVSGPFVDFEVAGVKRSRAFIWRRADQHRYSVSGDTAGRKVFGGTKDFENPFFRDAVTYEKQIAAGTKLLRGVIEAAHQTGMSINLALPVGEFPSDFSGVAPTYTGMSDGGGRVFLEFEQLADDPRAADLLKAETQAYLDTYPELDGIEFLSGRVESKLEPLRRLFSEREFWRRKGRSYGAWVSCRRESTDWDGGVSSPLLALDKDKKTDATSGVVTLFTGTGVLPLSFAELPERLRRGKQYAHDGFSITASEIGELDWPAYWLSRVSFEESLTFDDACRQLLDPVCGEGVAECVLKAMSLIDQSRHLRITNIAWGRWGGVTIYAPRNRFPDNPPPQSWSQARDLYLNAMNEMYRANTRAREGGRSYTLYFARRFEFAFEYMNCIEAHHKARIAVREKNTLTQIAELEKAIESLNNALNAMAAVARSNSDRGLIAVLNEHGYRPLKKKLAEAEAAAK